MTAERVGGLVVLLGTLALLALGVAGAGALGGGLGRVMDARSWEAARCRIETSKVVVRGSDSTRLALEYGYTAGGRGRRGVERSLWEEDSGAKARALAAALPVGAEVDCWVDPRDASRAVLHRGVQPVAMLYAFGAALGGAVLVLLAVAARGRWRRRGGAERLERGRGRALGLLALATVGPALLPAAVLAYAGTPAMAWSAMDGVVLAAAAVATAWFALELVRLQIDRRVEVALRTGDGGAPVLDWRVRGGLRAARRFTLELVGTYVGRKTSRPVDVHELASVELTGDGSGTAPLLLRRAPARDAGVRWTLEARAALGGWPSSRARYHLAESVVAAAAVDERPRAAAPAVAAPGATAIAVGAPERVAWVPLVVGVALLGGTLWLGVAGLVAHWWEVGQAQAWHEHRCRIDHLDVTPVEHSGRRRACSPNITYEGVVTFSWEADGGRRTSTEHDIGSDVVKRDTREEMPRRGSEVPCWVDPSNPARAVVDRSRRLGLAAALVVTMFLLTGAALVASAFPRPQLAVPVGGGQRSFRPVARARPAVLVAAGPATLGMAIAWAAVGAPRGAGLVAAMAFFAVGLLVSVHAVRRAMRARGPRVSVALEGDAGWTLRWSVSRPGIRRLDFALVVRGADGRRVSSAVVHTVRDPATAGGTLTLELPAAHEPPRTRCVLQVMGDVPRWPDVFLELELVA
ncbi:MAG TPA: DUF3592 domain-containing protein [Kofleriaceae bacterium]|nr:DUF3592 domain-containing protein [Kofleriaceae bacterium]